MGGRWEGEKITGIFPSQPAWPPLLLSAHSANVSFCLLQSSLSISVGDVGNCKSWWWCCVWSYKVKCNGEGERMELFIVFKVIFY